MYWHSWHICDAIDGANVPPIKSSEVRRDNMCVYILDSHFPLIDDPNP